MTSDRPHLSWTQINMRQRCGMQYYWRYIMGERCPPSVALMVGRSVHVPIQTDLQSKIDTGDLLPDEQIADLAHDTFVNGWESEEIVFTDEETEVGIKLMKCAAIDLTIALASLHHAELAPVLEPMHVEREFTIEIGNTDYDLVGRLDVQEPNTVRDTKTAGKSPNQATADRDEQLSLYALAVKVCDGEAPKTVHVDALVKTKTPKVVTLKSERADGDFQSLLLRIERTIEGIQKEVFEPCDPTHWCCTEKFCGYYFRCPFGDRKRVTG